jgi:hypothetical protein
LLQSFLRHDVEPAIDESALQIGGKLQGMGRGRRASSRPRF